MRRRLAGSLGAGGGAVVLGHQPPVRLTAYCRAAHWRVFDPGQAAKPMARTWADRQGGLFDQPESGQ